jgi:hypothetical protein
MVVSIVPSAAAAAETIFMNYIAPSDQVFKYGFEKISNHIHPLNSLLKSLSNRSTSNTSHGRLLAMYVSNRDWYPDPGNISAKRSNNRVISSDMVFSFSVFTMRDRIVSRNHEI